MNNSQSSTVNSQLIPTGYKQTEVGVIPEDWDAVPLGAVTSDIGDGIHATPVYSSTGEYYFINGNNLSDGHIVVTEDTKTVEHSEFKKHRKDLGDRSILMSINGTIGNLGLFAGEAVVLGKSAAYLNIQDSVSKLFVYHYLQTEPIKRQFSDGLTGTTIRNLGLGTIRNATIALPPTKVEQEAIAEALSDADALIESLEQLLAKKRQLKQGAMQELLTGKKRVSGFTGPWDSPMLGDLFTFKNGLNKAKKFFGCGTPIVNYMDVYGKRDILSDELKGRVSLSRDEIKAYEVRRGDVFFTRTSETAEEIGITSVMLDEPRHTVFSGFVLRARPKDDSLDDRFKKYCFSTSAVRKGITSQSTETTRALTNGRCLSVVTINRPPKPEQTVIAAILSDMDTEIDTLEAKLAKARHLKQGMMQELLTGRIRLI